MPKTLIGEIPFFKELGSKSLLKSLLTREKVLPTFEAFRKFIGKQAESERDIAFLVQKIIVNRVRQIRPDFDLRTRPKLQARMRYFGSNSFTKNFINEIPFGRDTSYTKWFNTIFGVKFSGWRDEMIIRRSNTSQCLLTIGETDTICYLCERDLVNTAPEGPQYSTKHCEHVLPLFSAIGHLWLTFNKIATYTPEDIKTLKKEYAWAHECCNMEKGNIEFIQINPARTGYELNNQELTDYYSTLKGSDSYDCKELSPKLTDDNIEDIRLNVEGRLTGILAIINRNIHNFGSLDTYHLFIKLKILSAFTNENFIKILSGEDGELVRVNFQSPEKRMQLKKQREDLKEDIKMDEIDYYIKRQIPIIKRGLRGRVRIQDLDRAVAKEIKKLYKSKGVPYKRIPIGPIHFKGLQYGGVTTLNKLVKNTRTLTTSENPIELNNPENPIGLNNPENPTASKSQENPTASKSQENPTGLTDEEDLEELTFPKKFLEIIGMKVEEISSIEQLYELYLRVMQHILVTNYNPVTQEEIDEVNVKPGSKLPKSSLPNEDKILDIEYYLRINSRTMTRSRKSLSQTHTRKSKPPKLTKTL
jgi:hypothetical protein